MKCADCLWFMNLKDEDDGECCHACEPNFNSDENYFCSNFEAHPTRNGDKMCGGCIYFLMTDGERNMGECYFHPTGNGLNFISNGRIVSAHTRACSKWRD